MESMEMIYEGKWQWKSNQHPWLKSEEPEWTFYSHEQNYLLEKAYYDQREEVDLGDYIVSVRRMIQKKKNNFTAQRPIRRIDWMGNVEGVGRNERNYETEEFTLHKIVNKVFGSLEDFIHFFSKRSPEMFEFAQHFNEIERSNDLKSLHSNIAPQLVHALEKELLVPILERLRDPNISSFEEKVLIKAHQRHEKLVSLFKEEFTSLREFYGRILKVYTMNTELYRNLNRNLRSENWLQIDNLLPYAFCLCKIFVNPKFNRSSNLSESASQESNSMVLYRGTALDEFALRHYDLNTCATFSWNSVTSISRNESIAKRFMYPRADLRNKKYPVMFIIEVPLQRTSMGFDYLGWMDVRRYSSFPKEEEVILPPGSAFELQEVQTNEENKTTTIKVKLRNEIIKSLASGGLIMHGARYSEMMTEREAKIMCLEGEELQEALKVMHGNRLIEELEFCMCAFDEQALKEVFVVLPTLTKLNGLKFISCSLQDKEDISKTILKNLKNFNISKMEISEINDFYEVLDLGNRSNWESLRSLTLDFGSLRKLTDEGVLKMSSRILRDLTQLTSLSLNFSGCSQITNRGISNLCSQGLEHLKQLSSFSLNLSGCLKLTDEGMNALCDKTLKNLMHLESLSLNVSECQGLTDRGLISFGLQALRYLTELKSLDLSFSECLHITDRGMHNLFSESLNKLAKLRTLSLNFNWHSQILNTEISYLCSQWRMHRIQLQSLNLDFRNCMQITDDGISRLCFQGLSFTKELTFLKMNFSFCTKITNKGLTTLCLEGLRHLTLLEALNLNFHSCLALTDKGFDTLCLQGLKNLTGLGSLDLDVSGCNKITEKGLGNLFSHGISHLSNLKSLKINSFAYPILHSNNQGQSIEQIVPTQPRHKLVYKREKNTLPLQDSKIKTFTDSIEVWKKLFLRQYFLERRNWLLEKNKEDIGWSLEDIQILFDLSQIVNLNFDVSWCEQTIKETNNQHSQGLKEYFTQLKSINLRFDLCGGITDREVENLCSLNLNLLKQLTSLSLSFRDCIEITDEGVEILCAKGLKDFTQLTSLDLNFSKCEQITDQAINTLCYQGLNHLPHLTSFGLNCSDCENITDKAINILYTQGFQHLHKLLTLHLDFSRCSQITFQGVKTLFSENLQKLKKIEAFSLKLKCLQIVDHKEKSNLATEGLSHLQNLTSLSLDFEECMQLTNEDVGNLCSHGLKNLNQLKSLTLNFGFCPKITNDGIMILCDQGIRYLSKLTALTLNFSLCHQITDEGIRILCSEGLSHFIGLESLHLDLSRCKITDKGMKILFSQGFSYFGQLTSLRLHLCHLSQFTNEGINIICSNGLGNLTRLKSLDLSFDWCEELTDEGVNNLCSQGLKHLSQLESLNLDFSNCKQITSFTMLNIGRVLRCFGFRNSEL